MISNFKNFNRLEKININQQERDINEKRLEIMSLTKSSLEKSKINVIREDIYLK